MGGKKGRGASPALAPPSTGDHGGGRLYGQGKKPTAHCRPFRRHKFQIIRFAASGKAHSFHCALAPVAALRFPGQTGPPIAPLLFPGSLYPPLAALRRETLPTEPASLGFGGAPCSFTSRALPRLGQYASGLPCKPCGLLRCTGLVRRAAVGAMQLKYSGSRGNRGPRRSPAEGMSFRACPEANDP